MEVNMLLKNDRKPAFAYATYQGGKTENSYRENDSITRMSADEDDFGNFTSGASAKDTKPSRKRQAPKKEQRDPAPAKKKSFMPFLIAGIAIVALIAIIALAVAIFNAPGTSSKIKDNVYFAYVDENDAYHVVVNGKEISTKFENEIELIPAADNSFAYIFENVAENEDGKTGIKMHILKGSKLETAKSLAEKCLTYSTLEPGVIYQYKSSDKMITCYYAGNGKDDIITKKSAADNFVISANSKTIVYTEPSSGKEGELSLKQFKSSGSEHVTIDVIPLAISPDGRYVYGTVTEGNLEYEGSLCYIDMKAEKIQRKAITNPSYGTISENIIMNSDGTEIIFSSDTTNGIYSFHYDVTKPRKQALTKLGQGVFTPTGADKSVLAPNTFIGTYFTAQTSSASYNEDGELIVNEEDSFATYCLKKDGIVKVADAVGQFSYDGKYFYYIDKNLTEDSSEYSPLMRITLSASKYDDDNAKKRIYTDIVDFALTQKGDIYMMQDTGDEKSAFLYYWDSTTGERTQISNDADYDSIRICSNTIYFSETDEEAESTTVYTSTDGSEPIAADFEKTNLTKAPSVVMGVGKKGYAYITDDNDVTMVFYTSNGKKFELVCDSCTLPGQATSKPSNNGSDNSSSSGNSSNEAIG